MARARKLKVYGCRHMRSECPPAANGGRQTREIVAAPSKREAARLVDPERPWMRPRLSEIEETGNDEEIKLAMSEPGVVFWCPLHELYRTDHVWRRA